MGSGKNGKWGGVLAAAEAFRGGQAHLRRGWRGSEAAPPPSALVAVVLGNGFRLGGIEGGGGLEVVRERVTGDLVWFRLPGGRVEVGLRRPQRRLDEKGGGAGSSMEAGISAMGAGSVKNATKGKPVPQEASFQGYLIPRHAGAGHGVAAQRLLSSIGFAAIHVSYAGGGLTDALLPLLGRLGLGAALARGFIRSGYILRPAIVGTG